MTQESKDRLCATVILIMVVGWFVVYVCSYIYSHLNWANIWKP